MMKDRSAHSVRDEVAVRYSPASLQQNCCVLMVCCIFL